MAYWKIALIVVAISTVCWASLMVLLSCLARRPDNLGVHEGRLRSCPPTPNCVCSFDSDPEHTSQPLRFTEEPAVAWQRLHAVLSTMPRLQIIREEGYYLHAESTSLVFRFVDDLEFLLDPEARVIHFRSASRAGRSDLGVNRARTEAIRTAFAEQPR